MDYPYLIVSSQKEESISIERVSVLKYLYKWALCVIIFSPTSLDICFSGGGGGG